MYPDWPESPADLIPLPLCDGPKMAAFDFQGPQQIEFLDYLGQGMHSHVVKVRIKDQEYALKLFRFGYDEEWYGPGDMGENDDREKLTLFAQYSESFYCECRAFGRLQEAGHADLAMACYGYILLDEAHERKLADRFALEFNGSDERAGYHDMRGRFLGKRSGKPPPIRGLVKALGKPGPINNPPNLTIASARRALRTTIKMHQLGIIFLDIRRNQFIDDKMCDFSQALTVPHFLTNPELNPHLNDEQKAMMRFETFMITIADYWNLENMFMEALDQPRQTTKLFDQFPIFPGGLPWLRKFGPRYHLRSAVGRRTPLYTLVDPRRYDKNGNRLQQTGTRRKTNSRQQRQHVVKFSPRPERWYLDYSPREFEKLRYRSLAIELSWDVIDGHLFPR